MMVATDHAMARLINRRRLLVGAAASAGVTGRALAATGAPPGKTPDAGAPALSDWKTVRDQFAVDRAWIHMSGFFLASHPAPVRAAIERHRRGLDEMPLVYQFNNGGRCEREAREAAAAYLGARAEDFALTDSTTMGLGLVYGGFRLEPGQEILTTEHDHRATAEALTLRAARTGAEVRRIALYDRPEAASADEIAGAIQRALRPRTRLVAVTWVHSGTGVKLPLRAIAEVIARANRGRAEPDRALLAVDGVHGLGVEDATVGDLGCDVFIAGCHKWLFGPRGTGLVWAAPHAWAATTATIPSFSGTALPSLAMTPGGFHSFEHRWALAPAFRFHQEIGKARVAARVHELNRQCKEGLARMKHVRLVTPRSDALSAGIVCFDVAGLTPQQVIEKLGRKKIVASVTPYAVAYARLAPGLLNMPEEVDRVLAEIRALA
jgi:selenocysteine lyase/cysteine desulfurase